MVTHQSETDRSKLLWAIRLGCVCELELDRLLLGLGALVGMNREFAMKDSFGYTCGKGDPLLRRSSEPLLIETTALVQHRLGLAALRAIEEDVMPVLHVQWIVEGQHRTAVQMVVAVGRKKVSVYLTT